MPPENMNYKLQDVPPAQRSRLPLVLITLAFVLLAIAYAGKHTTHKSYDSFIQYFAHLNSCICSSSHPSDALSPALKVAIEQHVIQTMVTHTGGDWDFARKAHGGRVALQVTSGYHGLLGAYNNDPRITIDNDTGPGKCWTMPPLPSQLGIRLPHLIRPFYISVDHRPDSPTQVERAPQNMTLGGVVEGQRNLELYQTFVTQHSPKNRAPLISKNLQWTLLVSFVYDIHKPHTVQTFSVSPQYNELGMTFGMFALEVYSNWGDFNTCLYKVGIYGSAVGG